MDPFGRLLDEAIRKKGYSRRLFAREVQCNSTLISKIIKGERTPPLLVLDRWMEALAVPMVERRDFRLSALLAHSPPELRAAWDHLEKQVKSGKDLVKDCGD